MGQHTRHPADAFIFAHADWECGREGIPCHFGPEASGRCSARAECVPQRDGDRWLCRRPLARGGACEKGPLPRGACCFPPASCVPRATTQRRLGTAWRLAALCALAAALALLTSRSMILPGPVLSTHAAFEPDCGQCHVGVAAPSLAWAGEVFRAGLAGRERRLANAARCLSCHDFGAYAMAAHTAGPPALPRAAGGNRERPQPAASRQPSPAPRLAAAMQPEEHRRRGSEESRGSIPCTVCHREHEGRDTDAARMTDAQCQTCHRAVFAGFPAHPPFTGYPHHAVSAVSFDHAAHFSRHFAVAVKDGVAPPDSCGSCHAGETMAILGFGACAACHEQEISRASPDLEFLTPPGLDLETLADAPIGDWPLDAEAEPNAFLRLMLEAGGYLSAEDLKTVAETDLMDLSHAGKAEKEAVARLAWAFKKLTRDLLRDGPSVFVEAARGIPGGAAVKADLAGSLPFEVVRRAASQWFPELARELERHGQGEEVAARAVETNPDAPPGAADMDAWLRYGGWRYGELALRYRSTGHADRLLRAWLTLAAVPTAAGAALFEALTGDEAPSATCAKCHVSREEADAGGGQEGPARVNWLARATHAASPPPMARSSGAVAGAPANPASGTSLHLRPFSHRSHRRAVAAGGCASCHRMAEGREPQQGPAGFAPVSPTVCAACHNRQTALAGCPTCHRYHFGRDGQRLSHAGGQAARNAPLGK